MLDIAIQGVKGCFHDAAAHSYFMQRGREITVSPCESFRSLFASLANNPEQLGIVAIENTIAGPLLQNHELLRQSGLTIVGEHKMRISHVLCALPGQHITDITEVHSHPMALMQCEEYLLTLPGLKLVEDFDTAGSAADIAAQRIDGRAAVCGRYAAELYGLSMLAEGIETNKRNFTRFLILAHPEQKIFETAEPDKASIVLSLPHSQGALSKVLAILSFYDLNLTKIQSTPIIGREWQYRFYIDLTFSDRQRYEDAMTAIRPLVAEFKQLGLYRDDSEPTN